MLCDQPHVEIVRSNFGLTKAPTETAMNPAAAPVAPVNMALAPIFFCFEDTK
jgi:hypothetical protein